MKITAFDELYSRNLGTGTVYLGGSNGSNSGFAGGDVVGEPGDLSVVGLRRTVALSSNLTGGVGDVLTIIATNPRTAQFATPSNSGNFELKNEGGQSTIFAHGSMGSTETFDPTDGNVHTGTLNANCTFTLNAPSGTGAAILELWLTEDSTGGWTVTWPGSVTEQGTHDTTLSTTQRVVLETIDGGTSWIATWVGGTSSGTSLPWFIVTDYGAVGDDSNDDTSAQNAAIAALNTAGRGVLYYPAGIYKTTGALTTITAIATIMGDGIEASKIHFTSTTAVLFTLTGAGVTVRDLWLNNSATTSAGAAISVTSGGNLNRYENLLFHGWWVAVDIQSGAAWAARGLFIESANKYGVKVTGTGPDWSLADSYFSGVTSSPDAAIYIAPSGGGDGGGGKIVNVKVNGDPSTGYATGIDLVVATGQATSILLVSNCSIENVSGDAIRATTTGTGRYSHITITGCQLSLYSNNSGRAVKISAATNGVFGTNGSIGIVTIDGSVFTTDGTARAAVLLTNTDRVTLGDFTLSGFNARYTSSGDTNTTDGASISYATPAIVLGTAAAAGAASTVIRSDSTIVAFDATSPTTQALGDAAATGSAAFAARRDHKHAMPALSSATPLVESGLGSVGTGVASSREDHVHPSAAAAFATDHFHIVDEQFSGDASTTVFALANEAVPDTVMAYVGGTRTPVTLGGSMNDQITFGSAPGSGTLNVSVDYAAVSA